MMMAKFLIDKLCEKFIKDASYLVNHAQAAQVLGVSRKRLYCMQRIVGFPEPRIQSTEGWLYSKFDLTEWMDKPKRYAENEKKVD